LKDEPFGRGDSRLRKNLLKGATGGGKTNEG